MTWWATTTLKQQLPLHNGRLIAAQPGKQSTSMSLMPISSGGVMFEEKMSSTVPCTTCIKPRHCSTLGNNSHHRTKVPMIGE